MGHITSHPVLKHPEGRKVTFTFQGKQLQGIEGEPVTSALVANDIWTFSRHYKDNAPQSLFCANGQCSKCMLLVDGEALKGCVTPLREGMKVAPLEKPAAPTETAPGFVPEFRDIEHREVDALIIGAGPAGLGAAAVLGQAGARVLIVDDKDRAGGKLVLQTHNFFGSVKDCYAGTRGIDIATKLYDQVSVMPTIDIMLNSVAVGVFSDDIVGIVENNSRYIKVHPGVLIVATGAREKTLPVQGFDLPGVFGAGAFQTLVNRDLVSCTQRLFIVGGGNVGLIAAYHALQAGMEVVGLAEALPRVGGYQVHADKIARLGVPLFLGHGAICAHGDEKVESVTIARLDDHFRPIVGTERSFPVDTILVAVGLNPIDELYKQARESNIPVLSAGDAQEIAEASAAMFSGRQTGLEAIDILGKKVPESLALEAGQWPEMIGILRARPGEMRTPPPVPDGDVYPMLHCHQEIPCDPCSAACPKHSIKLEGATASILDTPVFDGECSACTKCVAACPALAITLVDKRRAATEGFARVTVPFELLNPPQPGDTVPLTGPRGEALGEGKVLEIKDKKWQDRRLLITLAVGPELAHMVAGIRVQDAEAVLREYARPRLPDKTADDAIVCLCERVSAGEIRRAIRDGLRDINLLKGIRAGMGSCGGSTCGDNIRRIMKEEGCDPAADGFSRPRPLIFETPIALFAGMDSDKNGEK